MHSCALAPIPFKYGNKNCAQSRKGRQEVRSYAGFAALRESIWPYLHGIGARSPVAYAEKFAF